MNLNSVQKSLIYVLSCVISTLVACTCQVLLYKCKVHKDKVGKFFFFFFFMVVEFGMLDYGIGVNWSTKLELSIYTFGTLMELII